MKNAIAVVTVSLAMTVGVVVVVNAPWETQSQATGGPPAAPDMPATDRVVLTDWVPDAVSLRPARTGTLVYRSCVEDCAVTLVSSDGQTFDLDDYDPDLAARLMPSGLSGVSLSWDGTWWGYPVDRGGYNVAVTASSPEYELEADPPGSRWQLVGGLAFEDVSLAQWTGGRVTAYASIVGMRSWTYDAPDDLDLLPVDGGGGTVTVARPVEASAAGRTPRITRLKTYELVIPRHARGRPVRVRPNTLHEDLSSCLRPGETLRGPLGVPETNAVPPSRERWNRGPTTAITVFAKVDRELVPSAVVRSGCDNQRWGSGRYDLPRSTRDETWTFLGVLPGEKTAMTRHEPGSQTKDVVLIGLEGEQRVLHRVPVDAQSSCRA